MPKLSLGCFFLFALSSFVGLSVQFDEDPYQEIDMRDSTIQYFKEAVFENDGMDFPKSYGPMAQQFEYAALDDVDTWLGTASVTVGRNGPSKIIDPNGKYNRHIFIEALTPIHHRTDTHGNHWKNVLGAYYSGTIVSFKNGENVDAILDEHAKKHITAGKVMDAQAECDARMKDQPHRGDCQPW